MMEADVDLFRTALTDMIPWVKESGLRVDVFEERHVRLSVPKDKHLNHVGIIYAGSHFMLMEIAGAALFLATYGVKPFVPVNKGMSIRYLKPAATDIHCDLTITPEEARAKMEPIEARGKGEWILDMSATDENGTTVSTSTCTYYLLPMPK